MQGSGEGMMKKRLTLGYGLTLGLLMAVGVTALMWIGYRLVDLPFFPFDLFDWMTRVLPGRMVILAIETMVGIIRALRLGPTASTAKLAEQGIAVIQVLGGGALLGLVVTWRGRGRPQSIKAYSMTGAGLLLAVSLVAEAGLGFPQPGVLASVLWLLALFGFWGWSLGEILSRRQAELAAGEAGELTRRNFLALIGGAVAGLLVIALGIDAGERSAQSAPALVGAAPPFDASGTSGSAASPADSVLAARIPPAPGTRPELTANPDFYRIDINAAAPQVDGQSWKLQLAGLIDHPMTLTLDEIRARPAISQVVTMECISNPVGGDLTGTSRWTGASLKALLEEAGLQPGAKALGIQSSDGFYESVVFEDMMDERTLLVYAMNGEPLPPEHGFPLRIYIPNRFGMKQPKWIEYMEVLDHRGAGYWVDRGWSQQAYVLTTSVIDPVPAGLMPDVNGILPIGGIAWAGARGISKVEVQVDGGAWMQAELRNPPLSPLTWVQWRYNWQAPQGRHTVRVRAYDGKGELQETVAHPPPPNGATGVDERVIEVA
jgi:DMSO/TMAO reductase YedYZ molybdopterin-dependent catalytic subunit